MKPSSSAGALAALATATVMALASASYAATNPTHGAPVSPLLAKELAVLTNQGISPARAWQAIDVQTKAADLPSRLQAAMGERFAGMWFEPAAARYHIGVTSPADRQIARAVAARAGLAEHVVVTPVRSTQAQLLAVQKRLNRKLAGLFARAQASTGLEPQHNAVSVELSASVPASQREALEREAAAESVDVHIDTAPDSSRGATAQAKTECKTFVANEAFCNPSLTPGVRITSTFVCSAGPEAIPEASKKETVVLTAGHCIVKETEKWSTKNKAGVESVFGAAKKFVFGGIAGELKGDFAEISIEAAWQTGKANDPVLAVTAEWKKMNAKKEETSYPVKEERVPAVGNTSCHSGQTSGESCGQIMKLNKTVNIEGSIVEGLVEVREPKEPKEELIGEPGDSGGPWMFIEANNEALMEGSHSGEEFMCKKVANQMGGQFFKTEAECLKSKTNKEGKEGEWERKKVSLFFEPLKQPVEKAAPGSLQTLKLELLTIKNEFRGKGPFFKVKGVFGEKREIEGKAGKEYVLAAALAGIKIKCPKMILSKANVVGSTSEATGNFEACTVEGNGAGCEVEGKVFKTEPLLTTLGFSNKESKKGELLLGSAKSVKGALIGKVKFAGAECKFKEAAIEGSIGDEAWSGGKAVKLEEEPAEVEINEMNFPEAAIKTVWTEEEEGKRTEVKPSLKAFGVAATLIGRTEAKLAGGGIWGVFTK